MKILAQPRERFVELLLHLRERCKSPHRGLLYNRSTLGTVAALVMRAGAAVGMLALRASVSNTGNTKQRYDDSNELFHRVSQLSFVGVSGAGGSDVTSEISADSR
jgi:hypothetical protein